MLQDRGSRAMKNLLTKQKIFAAVVLGIRAGQRIRGASRIANGLSGLFLRAGISPIQEVRMRDGVKMLLDLRSQTERWAIYSGTYDDAFIDLIAQLLQEWPGCFLDVGGNVGMYSIRVAKSLPALNLCLSVEPMKANAQRIRENAELNSVYDRVEVVEVALSDRNGEAELVLREDFFSGADTGNASIAISAAADSNFQVITVPLARFDDILVSRGKRELFSVCKVDVEGHEDFFFRGASRWLREQRPVIFTEVNNWYFKQRGVSSSDAFEQALPHGYHALLIEPAGKAIKAKQVALKDLENLRKVTNCILCPAEKVYTCLNIIDDCSVGRLSRNAA